VERRGVNVETRSPIAFKCQLLRGVLKSTNSPRSLPKNCGANHEGYCSKFVVERPFRATFVVGTGSSANFLGALHAHHNVP
jgi:hypothetical protein